MPNLPLPRDNAGKLVLPGRVTHKLEADFGWATALPDWLSVPFGTPTFSNHQSGGRGELVITSGATTNSRCQLLVKTGYQVDLTKVETCWWQVEGFRWDSLGNSGTFFNISGSAYMSGGEFRSAGGPNIHTNTDLLSDRRAKSMGLLLVTSTKHAYLTEGDQIVADADYSATMTLTTNATPEVTIITNENVAKVMRVQKVSLTTTTN